MKSYDARFWPNALKSRRHPPHLGQTAQDQRLYLAACHRLEDDHDTPRMGRTKPNSNEKQNRAASSRILASPLDSLLFLAPLIIVYEVSIVLSPTVVVAYDLLNRFLDTFGRLGHVGHRGLPLSSSYSQRTSHRGVVGRSAGGESC